MKKGLKYVTVKVKHNISKIKVCGSGNTEANGSTMVEKVECVSYISKIFYKIDNKKDSLICILWK